MTHEKVEKIILGIMDLDHDDLIREILQVDLPGWDFTVDYLEGPNCLDDDELRHILLRAKEAEAEKAIAIGS